MSTFIQPDGIMKGTHDLTNKLSNRFHFSIGDDPTTKLLVRGAPRPTVNNNEVRIAHLNTVHYQKGRTEFDPLNITLYDFVAPSSTQKIMEWLAFHSEWSTGRDGYPAFYQKDCTMEIEGPAGDIVEKWIYRNCMITTANFGDFDWDNDTPVEINLTIRYQYPEFKF